MMEKKSKGQRNYEQFGCKKYKPNNSKNAKMIKNKLEEIGHTNVFVWWEPIGGAVEMCGNSGGYFYCSDKESIYPIGTCFKEAWHNIQQRHHIIKKEGESDGN